jgi:hypothetical protein
MAGRKRPKNRHHAKRLGKKKKMLRNKGYRPKK